MLKHLSKTWGLLNQDMCQRVMDNFVTRTEACQRSRGRTHAGILYSIRKSECVCLYNFFVCVIFFIFFFQWSNNEIDSGVLNETLCTVLVLSVRSIRPKTYKVRRGKSVYCVDPDLRRFRHRTCNDRSRGDSPLVAPEIDCW